MIFRTCLLVVVALLTRVALAEPLPSDPAIVTGKLDNGLSYMVRKSALPPGRAVMWVHIHSGSLNETDRQRGIAHYLEHMAFNGSENFPPGSLVPFFQSMGMTFGRDQNAFTSTDQTTYQLSLPKADMETLGKGMTFFADVLGRLSLLPTEIDAERQIIQEERRRGLSGRQRTNDYVMERSYPGSIVGFRSPIGTEATINSVQQQDFKDYVNKWYMASNATLLVVADAEPKDVIKEIEKQFGSLPAKPRPTPQDLGIKVYEKDFAIVTSDPEIRSERVSIGYISPSDPASTTVEQYREDLVQRIAGSAFSDRISDKIAAGVVSYTTIGASSRNDPDTFRETEISVSCQPGKWKQALVEMGTEVQRARLHGFTDREVEDVKKDIISGAERAVETEASTTSQGFVQRMNGAVVSREPILSPKQRLDLLNKLLPTITVEEISKRFAKTFEMKNCLFVAVLPSSTPLPTEQELIDAGRKALDVKPEKDAEVAHATSLMTDKPKAGSVVEGTEHADTKIWSGWLSNNVRVHYRFMDREKNQATIRISLLGGELLETAENRGITSAAQLAWMRPATMHLTSSDIRELMTGKKVSVRGGGGFGGGGGGGRRGGGGGGGGGGGDSISLTISGSPDELEAGFQLAYLMLTEPKIELSMFQQMQNMTKQLLAESLKNPMALGMRTAGMAPYPDNEVRLQPVTAEQIDKLTLDNAQAWLEKLIKTSPIEVTIVGDIPQERALKLTSEYIGALPTRERVSPDMYSSLRHLQRPAGPRVFEKSVDTPTQQAFVLSGFYGADENNRADARALSMAARILSTRMVKQVREEAQLVYSISAGSRAATTYPGFGVFSAGAPTDPSKVDALVKKLSSMYEEFAKHGPTQEELDVAKKQFATTYEEQMKEPQFWMGRMGQMTFRAVNLDDILKEPDFYQQLTTQQVKDTFGKYYSKDNAIVVVVRPNNPSGGANPSGATDGENK